MKTLALERFRGLFGASGDGLLTRQERAHIRLAWDLAVRDLESRYARSILGTIWLILYPLLLVGVYWVVFGYILKISWVDPNEARQVGYIVPFVPGLLVYLLLMDVINSSLSLYQNKRNYVLKSPFPLWVLWLSNFIRCGVQATGLLATMLAVAILSNTLTLAGLLWLLPCIFVIVAFCAGLSLLLASIGPFASDLSDALRLVMRVLFYAAPITYPLSIVPEHLRWVIELNPLTQLVGPLRAAVAFGDNPEPIGMTAISVASVVLWCVGYWAHSRLKGAIADVV